MMVVYHGVHIGNIRIKANKIKNFVQMLKNAVHHHVKTVGPALKTLQIVIHASAPMDGPEHNAKLVILRTGNFHTHEPTSITVLHQSYVFMSSLAPGSTKQT